MKVCELIELLKSKPQNLPVYLQDCENVAVKRIIYMASLDASNVAVMDNEGCRYLAIGCTADGIARADGSKITNVDKHTHF